MAHTWRALVTEELRRDRNGAFERASRRYRAMKHGGGEHHTMSNPGISGKWLLIGAAAVGGYLWYSSTQKQKAAAQQAQVAAANTQRYTTTQLPYSQVGM